MFPFAHGVIASNNATPASNPLWNGLYSAYNFDNNVLDLVGSNNGTLQSGATYTASGKINDAVEFDGVNGYVGLGSNNFKFTTDFSFSVWVYIPSIATATNGIFANYTNQVGPLGFIAYLRSDGKFEMYIFGTNGTSIATTTNQIPIGWTHIAVTRTLVAPKETKIYINGAFDSQSGVNNTVTLDYHTTTNPSIGAVDSINGGAQDLFGVMMNNSKIDELYIWNRVITSTEVTELYNGGVGLQHT